MRYVILVVVTLSAAFAGEWLYRLFLRPIEPLAPEAIALAAHFNQNGIQVRPYPVRHGFRYSQVLSVAAFEIVGFPLPIAVTFCPSEASAIQKLSRLSASPNMAHPNRNGRLVMDLSMWGDDIAPMATKVVDAFMSFKSET